MPRFALILPAAGKSVRYGGPRNKLQELLGGRAIIQRALDAFLIRPDVAQAIIATSVPQQGEDLSPPVESSDPRVRFTPGGANRAQSVLCALRQVSPEIEWVAIHDAARPLSRST